MKPMNADGLLKVLHQLIDLIGGGAQHLHADLDAAFGRTPAADGPPALTQAEQDTLAALEARKAAIDAANAPAPVAVPAPAPAADPI